jgi:uncharacterized protein (TIGR02391 family)
MSDKVEIIRKLQDESILISCAFCDSSGVFPDIPVLDDVFQTEPCPICKGSGCIRMKIDTELLIKCRYCSGSGKGWDENGYFMGEICPSCKGRGVLLIDSTPLEGSSDIEQFWSLLHPIVVKVSSSRFNSGHYADAVEASLKEINSIVKKIVKDSIGEELDGSSLMQRALSVENPIIKMADLSNESGKNIQKGYIQIFSGTMTGIRNPKTHGNIDLDKSRAIHLLFLSSLLISKVIESDKWSSDNLE